MTECGSPQKIPELVYCVAVQEQRIGVGGPVQVFRTGALRQREHGAEHGRISGENRAMHLDNASVSVASGITGRPDVR